MDLDGVLANPPATHRDREDRPLAWQIARRVLEFLDEHVTADSRTLETGAGLSTALFAAKGAEHTCVVPFTSEIERLQTWAADAGVSMDRVTFHRGPSDEVLPTLEDTPLDLVLVDGGHGFPIPFIDWWYAGRRLRVGGLLVIDDTQLWTGRVLTGFLGEQPGWEQVERLPMRSAMFRRTSAEPDGLQEWGDQPFVVRRSYVGGARGLVRKAVRGAPRMRGRETP
jgi:predicted O-methyltransferase YrrM